MIFVCFFLISDDVLCLKPFFNFQGCVEESMVIFSKKNVERCVMF